MKKFLLSIFAVMLAVFSVQAEEVTFNFKDLYGSATVNSPESKTVGGITISYAKNSASTAPAFNKDGTLRLYYGSGKGGSATFTTDGTKKITGAVITAISTSYTPNVNYSVDGGNPTSGLWDGAVMTISNIQASNTLMIQNANTTNTQLRITSIVLTVESGAGEGSGGTPVPTFNPVSGTTFEETLEVVITATDGAAIHYTLNGEEPNTDSEIYSDPIVIDETSTVKAIAVVDGVSSSVAEATYTKVKLIDLNGCSVADAIEAYGNGQTGNATIVGYIVGTMVDNKFVPGSEGAVAANLVIADDPNETDYSKCIPVQLSSGTIRDVLNLLDTPANLGRKVTLSGSLEKYFTVAGLKSLKTAGLYWNVSEAGYATLYLGYKVVIPETVKAYLATGVAGKYVALSEVTGILPANTGLILEGEGEHLFNITSSAATVDVDANLLTGTLIDTEITKGEGNSYYILANGEEGIGFYNPIYDGDENKFNNAANKAYLVVPAEQAEGIACYSFRFGEGTTGIDEITDNREQSTAIYDLTGRRVEAITAPGIYVVNGKKVLVK